MTFIRPKQSLDEPKPSIRTMASNLVLRQLLLAQNRGLEGNKVRASFSISPKGLYLR